MALPSPASPVPFRNRALDRRAFLRGAGACVALPWLDAMVPARPAAPLRPPLRALFVFAPNGMKMDEWWPSGEGRDYTAPYLLEPLQAVRAKVTVFSGLAIDGGFAHGDGPGDHARAGGSYLTCAHPKKTGGADIRAGVSADQVIAQALGDAVRFPSLELGMEGGRAAGACDSGYSCAYSNNLSWRTPTTPIAKEIDPRAVFARLFGDPEAAGGREARAREREATAGVLDAVLADLRSLRGRLGAADRSKLDDYLAAVRELEERLARAAAADAEAADAAAAAPPVPEGLLEQKHSYPERLALMYEMIALAFATDRTRVVSFMLGNAGSNRSYRFLGVNDGHHELSHHKGEPRKLQGIRRINRFHTEQFGAFLQRLDAAADGDGSLLDRSLIVYGSGLSDGNRHTHDELPVVLCGSGGGAVAGGRHVVLPRRTPMANLYLAIQQAMGVAADSFADSTGPLLLR